MPPQHCRPNTCRRRWGAGAFPMVPLEIYRPRAFSRVSGSQEVFFPWVAYTCAGVRYLNPAQPCYEHYPPSPPCNLRQPSPTLVPQHPIAFSPCTCRCGLCGTVVFASPPDRGAINCPKHLEPNLHVVLTTIRSGVVLRLSGYGPRVGSGFDGQSYKPDSSSMQSEISCSQYPGVVATHARKTLS